MNSSKKIIFFDIDGTIYQGGKGTPDSTRKALQLLKEKGHIPVICTGRPRAALLREHMALGITSIIAGAGTYIEYEGKILRNRLLDNELLKREVDRLEGIGCTMVLEGPEYLSYRRGGGLRGHENLVKYFSKEYPERIKEMDPERDRANKMTAWIGNKDAFDRVVPELARNFTIARYERAPYAELIPAGITKADGIRALIEYLGIPRENTYAFGDGPNDLEMLQYVQYGTAMGNSEECVLQTAKYRTEGIWEDGVYLALERYGLI